MSDRTRRRRGGGHSPSPGERELRRERQFVSAVIDTVGALVLVLDRDGCVVRFNRACEQTTGFRFDEVQGRPVWDLLPVEEVPAMRAAFERLRSGDLPGEFENDWLTKSGERRLLAWAASALVDDAGAVEYVIATGIDITERRRAEEALAESDTRYHLLVDTVPAMVATAERDGSIGACNRRWLEYTGLSLEETREWAWRQVIHPDDLDGVTAMWRERIPRGRPFDSEFRLRRADGVYRWHLVRCEPVRNRGGRIVATLATAVDIDDRRRVEQEREELLEDLRRASVARDEFLGMVSHELKTPITTIYGNVRRLRRRQAQMDQPTRDQALVDIEDEATRLNRIVDNMLVLSRAERRQHVVVEPVLVQHVLKDVANEHRQHHPHRRVAVHAPRELPPASADPTYLGQVVRNLLTNVEKYCPADSPVDILAGQSGEMVTISVLDRGPGIAADEAESLFAPFYRSGRTARSASGTGIGLAVCRLLVEAQGGQIEAYPREGGGAVFSFTLPLDLEAQLLAPEEE